VPEIAEIKTLGDQIGPLTVGRTLISVISMCKNHDFFTEIMTLRLPAKVLNVTTHGKRLSWELSIGYYVNFTFGMTGTFTLQPEKHNRIEFLFDDGSKVFFSDIRRFGNVTCDRQMTGRDGVDPFTPVFTPAKLDTILKSFAKKRLAEVLLDQNGISGIGNYLRAEILYHSRLNPWRTCDSLNMTEKLELYQQIKRITADSYAAGGATLATYRNVQGKPGNYAKSLKVYKKKSDPSGNAVVRELDKTKRAMWWVPSVQV
jgi:formamidopyrimidine-DNA glycosylase